MSCLLRMKFALWKMFVRADICAFDSGGGRDGRKSHCMCVTLGNAPRTLCACQVLSDHLVFTAWSDWTSEWTFSFPGCRWAWARFWFWELVLIMASFSKRKPHLHNWVSGGTSSGCKPAVLDLKRLSWGKISISFRFFLFERWKAN